MRLKKTIMMTMLLSSCASVDDSPEFKGIDPYDSCFERSYCEYDNQRINHLSKQEQEYITNCRINRHINCLAPRKDD